MEVFINDKRIALSSNTSLQDAICDILGSSTKGKAVAVNNTVIKKDLWIKHILKENDKILIINATQGG